MAAEESETRRRAIAACRALYLAFVGAWWLLALRALAPGGARLWRPIQELVFGQAVFFDRLLSATAFPAAPLVWLLFELAAATAMALAIERRGRGGVGPCWPRALVAGAVIQGVLYGLGVLVGE